MNSNSIPQEIIDVADSDIILNEITGAIQAFDFNIDQIGNLDVIVRKTLKGKIPREKLLDTLVEELEIDEITANKLIKNLNVAIFQKLRELILATHQSPQEQSEQGMSGAETTQQASETLSGIEHPETIVQSQEVKIPINILDSAQPHDIETVPGEVAHDVPRPKITNPLQTLSTPSHNPVHTEIYQPKKPMTPPTYETTDPYREPLQ